MNFDSCWLGASGLVCEDRSYERSRYSEVRDAVRANRYYLTWGTPGDPPLPTFGVTLGRALRGLLTRRWRFQQAARRAVASDLDLRWGPDGRGFRRILHPNAVCLFGRWEIDAGAGPTGYSGYFKEGSAGLIVARYSTCCTEPRSGYTRSLSMVGKLYPTTDPDHPDKLRTANFITQEDLGGARSATINDAELRNAPDVSPLRRGAGLPVFLLTGIVLARADKEPSERQLYPIAELGKPEGEPTRAPRFMRLLVDPEQPRLGGHGVDFRDEILEHIYRKGDPRPAGKLTFRIEVSDAGAPRGKLVRRVSGFDWKPIGRIVFDEAAASYNGDFVLHFAHPPWRNDRNDPRSLARHPRGS